MADEWIEFAPNLTTRPAIALEPSNRDLVAPADLDSDHIASGAMPPGMVDGNPATVLIAIRTREGTTYCAATDPAIARVFANDILAACEIAEGGWHG